MNVILKVNIKCYQAPFETPYVVRLSNVDIVAEPKPCFHFVHPNRGKLASVCILSALSEIMYTVCSE